MHENFVPHNRFAVERSRGNYDVGAIISIRLSHVRVRWMVTASFGSHTCRRALDQ
ncbi:MAG TPA: hypothetical protein VFS22_01345 [Flavisolibacter sp.]|nr:hypothetical protein [Flavisolibacter sp.]